jgi:hypothetical protein
MRKRTIQKKSPQTAKKMDKAMTDYLVLKKEIEPFIKKRVKKEYSTIGHWMTSEI